MIVFDLNVRAESYGYEGERKRAMEKMIGLCDILLGSGKEEFAQVTGLSNIRKAADRLQVQGAKTVIARDGGNPILVLDRDNGYTVPVKPIRPISTVGAGDCFDAMFLSCLSQGKEIPEAVLRASDYAGLYISGGQFMAGPPES